MRNKKQIISILVVSALVWSCSGSKMNLRDMSAKGFQINYKPKVGSVAKYQVSSNSDITQNMMGQEQNFGTKVEVDMNLMVNSASDNGISYDITYGKVNVESNSPGITGIDSYKEKLLSSKIKVDSNPSGKVTKVSGTDEIKELALGGNIDLGLKSMFLVFPDKSLKIGDDWQNAKKNTVVSGPLTIEVNSTTTYKFTGIENYQNKECLKFDFKSKSQLTGSGEQAGMKLEFEGLSYGTGVIYFDYVSGFLVSSTSEETIEGVVAVPSQGMDIPMTIIQNSTMSLSE